jgi:hypothetical protein
MAGRTASGRETTASRGPAWASRTTTCPADTTWPGSANVSTTVPSTSASRVEYCFVFRDACFGFRRGQLRLCRIQRSLGLFVSLRRHRNALNKHGIAFFIGPHWTATARAAMAALRLGHHNKAQIALVDLHRGLSGLDLLTHVDETLHDFSGHAKAQIALHPGGDAAGEAAVGFGGRCGHGQPDERSVPSRIADGRGLRRAHENHGPTSR